LEPLSEQAYRSIRRDILSGILEPSTKLKIETLKERYKVGPTPLREALSRLATEELVQIVAQRGFRVASLSLAELEDITETRIVIEGEALRRSIQHGDYDWEARIVAAFHRLDRVEADRAKGQTIDIDVWEERNRDFHDALLSATQSIWINRLRNQLYDHHERYRRFALSRVKEKTSRNVHAEHRAIMEATLARKTEQAVAANRAHIERTLKDIGHAWLD
jgi:DNA-binding GntR family transcriptional regulator